MSAFKFTTDELYDLLGIDPEYTDDTVSEVANIVGSSFANGVCGLVFSVDDEMMQKHALNIALKMYIDRQIRENGYSVARAHALQFLDTLERTAGGNGCSDIDEFADDLVKEV